ncbi:winged helix-turn-helix domain-containing protein [Amycolatopsis pithecellobii]|uniref:GntR family transcriptional regulator n=1 Tax=Amycolatopsis pithecellobii TaxID=664692 RepID=A0A6N7ZAM4_9PSEU|nr:winged helix-turn-helix domain-containing protein [Amycolatopsis pithecellobii]MTD58769.1 GntR family transcriptional regulator [Amycolatopsis pithecellobii]
MSFHEELRLDLPGYAYERMAEHIAGRIASGELELNTPLPSERRLAEEYGVSLGTARHATKLLRFRGLVVTVRSKGTYIADRRERPPAEREDQ